MTSNIIDTLSAVWSFFNDYLLIFSLLICGVFYFFLLKGLQLRYLKHSFTLLWDKNTSYNDDKVNISPVQSFLTGLAARIGMGNIAGVAAAIAAGGPGAVFWMWVAAFLGMGTAFVENTLAQVYKTKIATGEFKGGPAFYITYGLKSKLGGLLFSLVLAFTYGFAFISLQTNQISESLNYAFDMPKWIVGFILVFLTGIIIFSNLKTIANVSGVLIPIMSGLYILMALILIVLHITELPRVIYTIVTSAFNTDSAFGATIGVAINYGVKRGLFSNEAGMGSSPNIAASANVKHPVSQGFVQMVGIFFDTIVICSLTAFMVLMAGVYGTPAGVGLEGASLAQASVEAFMGRFGAELLVFIIFLFAFTSVLGYYTYGSVGIYYITDNKWIANLYRIAVLGFTFWGAYKSPQLVWNTADVFMAVMCFMNVIACLLLWRPLYTVYKDYRDQLKAGIKTPIFDVSKYPSLAKTLPEPEIWDSSRHNKEGQSTKANITVEQPFK
ncbi:hypothetical protein CJP74_04830 [Psittacicella melopsittaci]|uniref:Sodium:alanine symporter family protein n=1 Tax=Psittacicella melopsittaci TaxID=2028576 RepID=A0A3A1Y885_9GAMM|nr:alanine/glycine:cation symporter family protein [Psittacicella melopsittaci]RIY32324.1 hypothetical protein CJP74_04830 [Psittacicella melopsittaci]